MGVAVAIALVLGLSFANGANDVSKGIATLVGSGVSGYRRAIAWGAGWTAVGAMLGSLFAGAMIGTFGHGMTGPETTPVFAAALGTICGAAAWVLVATRTGLPVSTTHAIVGSMSGVAVLAYGAGSVQGSLLLGKVVVPLLVSPAAAFLFTSILLRTGIASRTSCVCTELRPGPFAVLASTGAMAAVKVPSFPQVLVTAGTIEECAVDRSFALQLTVDHLHWLSSGATSLARGMNDAPKIVALLVVASASTGASAAPRGAFAAVTLAMLAGSLVAGRRVTRVLAEDVTPMDHREGLAANLVTAGLVIAGAVWGLPMSTTHVSAGGIGAAAVRGGSLDRRTLKRIALAWIVTVPCAGALGAAAYEVARVIAR